MSERVKVNHRVPSDVLEAYKNRIRTEKPQIEPYGGVILEIELKIQLSADGLGEFYDSLPTHSSSANSKKNNPVPGGESKIVQFRIDPSVRAQLRQSTKNTPDNPGDILARVMWNYAQGNGFIDRVLAAVSNEGSKSEYDDLSAVERRKEQIKDWLRERFGDGDEINQPFELDDFDRAAAEAADVTTKSYAREKYLRDVLDEMNVQVTTGNIVPCPEDADTILYPRFTHEEYLREDDMVEGVIAEALENPPVHPEDIMDIWDGTISQSRARDLMEKAGNLGGETGPFDIREDHIGPDKLVVNTSELEGAQYLKTHHRGIVERTLGEMYNNPVFDDDAIDDLLCKRFELDKTLEKDCTDII